MSDETERAKEIADAVNAADAKKRADAEAESSMGTKLDKLLECIDAMGKRMDSFETSMMDSLKRKDAEGEEIMEKGDPKELKVDSRADSADVLSELAHIQSYADRACSAWSKSAPAPWSHEMPDAYRRRLANDHQKHSENWRDVDLYELKGTALKNACQQIFANSINASKNVSAIGEMNLREVRRRDPDSGHMIKEYYGDPQAWMAQFSGGRRLAKFNFNRNGG
jgi:hypothetical protein